MVKYNSKGNLPQNADYYALLNRSDADWRDTVRQGLVFSSAGAGCLNYGNRSLITGSTTKMRWQFRLNDINNSASDQHILAEYEFSSGATKRNWSLLIRGINNKLGILTGNSGGTTNAINQDMNYTPVDGDFLDLTFNSGILTLYKNGVLVDTKDYSAFETKIYNNSNPALTAGGRNISSTNSYNGSISNFKIWVDNILDTDTPKFVAPMGDKQGIDLISGTIPTVVGTVDMTARADDASYDCEENGFAVQGGDIYSKNYAGTGYAGLVGDPDKIYYPGPYPNTFTGNWHELTHAYFDKSDTDIWEDYVRESINYISEEPNYWHVSELTQDFIDTYVKAAYADKIFVGLDATDSDYAGAVMVFESGITADQLKDLNFWRKRKYFPERV